MSYILDALSKSQQEREHADVPTLATPFPIAAPRRRAPGILVGIGLAALCAGVLVTAFALSGRGSAPGRTGGEASAPAPALPAPIATEPSTTRRPRADEQVDRADLEVAAVSGDSVRRGAGGGERGRPPSGRKARLEARPEPGALESSAPELATVAGTPDPTVARMAGRRPSSATQWLMKEISALDRRSKQGMVRADEPQPLGAPGDTVASVSPDAEQPRPSPPREPAVALAEPTEAVAVDPTVDGGEPATPLRDLPPETRSALPRLEVNVHSYSPDRERRMVLINMKRYGEGDRLAEGPLIQSITPTGVVLVHGRQRFSIPAR